MNQKQNNKFVLGRLYPQYFNPVQEARKEQQQLQASKIHKNPQEKKIQSKLKSIIYNLQRQIQEQTILNRPKYYRNLESKDSMNSNGSMRSFSQKQLHGKIHRYRTQLDPTEQSEYTQRSILQHKLKRQQSQNRQSETLILPKLKMHTNTNSEVNLLQKKQVNSKKKKKKLQILEEQQQQLGKIVLKKVQEHFKKQKQGRKHYFERVKSEEGIDHSLVQYLKNKVKKADVALDR